MAVRIQNTPASFRLFRIHVISLLAIMLALGACASSQELVCLPDEQAVVMETLYFGTAMPGGAVTSDAWDKFLRHTVTPLFPKGLTFWGTSGQWQSSSGGPVEREDSYVLQLTHPGSEDNELAIRTIIKRYKEDFHQEAVLRIRSRGCQSL